MIGSVYVYPEESTCVHEDQFVLLQRELCNLPCHDSHILCGDVNARTNVANDYIVERNYGSDGLLSELLDDNSHSQTQVHTYLKNNNILERYSMDRRPMNRHGSRLIELCKTSNMSILNGRCGRDYGVGRYTRVDTTGCSVIDHVLCTTKVQQRITEFQVGNKMPESDHNPVTFSIKLNSPVENIAKSTHTWTPVYKYKRNQDGMDKLGHVLNDNTSENFKEVFYTSVLLNANVDTVATSFTEYFGQACYRAYGIKRVNQKRQSDPNWFDAECRAKRNEAIKAGAHVESDADRDTLVETCNQYRSLKQQKKWAFSKKCASEIESGFQSSTSGIHFPDYLKMYITMLGHLEMSFENEVLDFLRQYDTKCVREPIRDRLEFDILNENVTVEEIESAIDSLKNNKAVGIDMIPAEFIKYNKGLIVNDLCILLNYMIEQEEFPDSWAEGVRSSIHKSGPLLDPQNHRRITVLPIFEKVFEIIVQRRLEFINEAFMRKDRYNGGFLKGSQTADNLFILQSLIERQLALGQNLIVRFIDFSRAFDLMNRNILFYKLIKSGLHGRVINTLRNLYTKTYFRVKQGGYLSDLILQEVGVNQGGNASPIIFRKYLSDLRSYLNEKTGVILSEDEILVHLLWADDLIMTSTTTADAHNQLNGLSNYCSKHRSIVNSVKTKFMVYGKLDNVCLYFNGQALEQVTEYDYLGNIVRSVERTTNDVFAENYEYLCNKARRSIFSIFKKTKNFGSLPPKIRIYLFDSLYDLYLYMDAPYGVLELTAGDRWIKFTWCISGQSWGLKPTHQIL